MHIIRQIAHGAGADCDLSEQQAYELFAGMLDGSVGELELGALLVALRLKTEAVAELLGFHRALTERLWRLPTPAAQPRPVILPAYGGARTEHNLLPLLGLLLRRLGVPVVFHGTLEGGDRVASAHILREFGVLPSATPAQLRDALERERIAYVPIAALSPGLANLLSLRYRLGLRSSADLIASLVDPFGGDGVLIVGASGSVDPAKLASVLAGIGAGALLL